MGILALLGVLSLCSLGPIQAPGAGYGELLEQHAANLWAEREDAFFRAWDVASEDLREDVEQTLGFLVSVGAPSEVRPSLGAIGVATRILQGANRESLLDEGPAATLAVQALAMDLIVAPGQIRSRTGGSVSPYYTVTIKPLFDLRSCLDVHVRLIWIDPNGREYLGREEPAGADLFRGEGFRMYARFPDLEEHVSGNPPWRLVMELAPDLDALEGGLGKAPVGLALLGAVRGEPVIVPQLTEDKRRAGRWDELATFGLRLSSGAWDLASTWMGSGVAVPVLKPAVAPEARLLLVGHKQTWPGAGLGGLVGTRWRAQSQLDVSLVDPGSIRLAVQSSPGDLPRVLVLRGGAVLAAQIETMRSAASDGPMEVDALVVVASKWRPSLSLPAVPTLLLCDDKATVEAVEKMALERVQTHLLEHSVFLSELELPGLIADFVRGQAKK